MYKLIYLTYNHKNYQRALKMPTQAYSIYLQFKYTFFIITQTNWMLNVVQALMTRMELSNLAVIKWPVT